VTSRPRPAVVRKIYERVTGATVTLAIEVGIALLLFIAALAAAVVVLALFR